MDDALDEIASLRALAHLSLGGAIPGETTILNFRHLLEANDLAEDILKTVNAHLARKGLLLKRGCIMDATIGDQSGLHAHASSSLPQETDVIF